MAIAIAYKNIAVAVESSYGTSLAAGSNYASIRSFDMSKDPNFELKEDTSASIKGYDRSAYLRNMLEGSINFNTDPVSMRYWMRLAFGDGATVVGTAEIPGGGATAMTFPQNSDGVLPSYRIDVDRDTSQDGYLGVVANQIELTSSGDFVEGVLSVTAQEEFSGTSLSPTGITVNPFVFAEANIYVGATVTGCTQEYSVDSFRFTYNNQAETTFQSGSRDAARVDPKVPVCDGEWERFYDDTNFKTYTEDESTKAILIDLVSSDTYSGTSPYRVAIYIPQVRFTRSERSYEASTFKKEIVGWNAIYDSNVGYLARAFMFNGLASF